MHERNAEPETLRSRVPATRRVAGLLVGSVLWSLAVFVAHSFPVLVLGRELQGATWAIVALLFAPLAFAAVATGLRVARCPLTEAGFAMANARTDVLIGVAVAVTWAALQFLVIIPLTGGEDRADIVVNAEQLGSTLPGLAGFLLLAWAGGFAEEVFFRAHLMTMLRKLLGTSPVATAAVVLVPTVLFALMHGYQGGWVGMLDTGIYGGATLSLLFLRTGRLLPCVVAHAVWNTIAAVVIFAWF